MVEVCTNPFSMRPGERPAVLVGRSRHLAVLDDTAHRLGSAQQAAAVAVSGLAGMGVTSMLYEIAERLARRRWATAVVSAVSAPPDRHGASRRPEGGVISARELLADGLDTALDGFAERGLGETRLPRLRESVDRLRTGLGGTALDGLECLRELGHLLLGMGSGIMVLIDDAHRLGADAAMIASVSGATAERGLPATVVVGGLPMRLRGTTVVDVGPIGAEQVEDLLVRSAEPFGVEIHPSTISRVTSLSRGTPFLVQSFAHHGWRHARGTTMLPDDVDAGVGEARSDMTAMWYGERTLGIDGASRRYLTAVADLGSANVDVNDISRLLGDTTRFGSGGSALAEIRERLLLRGLLCTRDGTTVSFALPAFDRYVQTQW